MSTSPLIETQNKPSAADKKDRQMAKLTQNHVITRLLREGIIEGSRNLTLYDTLLDLRSDVEAYLRTIGMELVVLPDIQVAHARNMSDDALDALASDMSCEPISTISSHRRLTYYESVAIIFFRMSLDQEARQGGDPIWINEDEVIETLSHTYSEAVAEDQIALETRILQVLRRLIDLNLLDVRPMGKASRYRGRPLMQAAFSRDQITEFAQTLNMIADKEDPMPETRAPSPLVDLEPDLIENQPITD